MLTAIPASPKVINPDHELRQIYRSQVNVILAVSIVNVIGLSYALVSRYFPITPLNDSMQVILIGLLTTHIVLHWLSGKVERRLRLAIIYIFVQIVLLFSIGILGHYPVISLFLPPLLAEIIVIFEAVWLAPIVITVASGLYLITDLLINTLNQTPPTDISMLLSAFIPGMVLTLWSFSTILAAYFLIIRSRRQMGVLLVNLDSAHRQLAVYADQVEQLTMTAERARMARELHDTLAQGVVGLILQLEALDSQFERGDNARVAATLTQIKNLARATLKESRAAIDDLRLLPNQPSMILSSIADEVTRFSTLTGVTCTIDLPSSLILPTSTTEHTIRFVSEGLANIAKHAAASNVDVQVKVQEREVLLEIQDDGIGFDPAAVTQNAGHYGLLGLQERARLVGGKFEVESTRNKGTTLRLHLPKLN